MENSRRETVMKILSDAIVHATRDIMPFSSSKQKALFRPMDRICSAEELLWTLEYVDEEYHDRITVGEAKGQRYLIWIEQYPIGHPVFLLGSLYTLLLAEADVWVFYSRETERLYDRLVAALIDHKICTYFKLNDPNSALKKNLALKKCEIEHIVVLGEFCNFHHHYGAIKSITGSTWHVPTGYLLLAEYAENPELNEKLRKFADKCWSDGSVDYIAFRTDRNQAKQIVLGFDFMDLFKSVEEQIAYWNDLTNMTDRVPAVIFTDRPREQIMLPEGMEKCCNTVFFEDYDVDYPLYDFLQLLHPQHLK